MRTKTAVLEIDGTEYPLRWDFNAIATFEDLTGLNALDGIPVNARTVLAALWACIDAGAAARDEPAPVSYRVFGSLLDSEEKQTHALEVFGELLKGNMPEPKEGEQQTDPPAAARPNRSQRRAATRSARSTSESQSASSGA